MKYLTLNFILLLPFFYGLIKLFILEDVNDPIKYIYILSGVSSTVILFLTISISLIKEKINLMKYRKNIGLIGFFYAFLHLINFFIFDAQLDFKFVLEETLEKPFIYLGMISFFIILFMALTSTKTLFRKYNKYHKAVYIALFLITIHWIMAQKSINEEQFIYLIIAIFIAIAKFLKYILNRFTLD